MIFIPTKGRELRASKKRTWDHLYEEGIDYRLVVEPQDMDRYKNEGDLLVLPENDRGIAFARDFIHKHMTGPSWVIDDDIQSCAESTPSGIKTVPFSRVFELCEADFDDDVFLSGPGYVQSARSFDSREWKFNRNISSFYRVHPDAVVVDYDTEQLLFQDLRFAVENILAGKVSAQRRQALFRCPGMGGKSESGGCTSFYATDGLPERMAKKFTSEVPHCGWVYNDSNAVRIRMDWRAVDENHSDVRRPTLG